MATAKQLEEQNGRAYADHIVSLSAAMNAEIAEDPAKGAWDAITWNDWGATLVPEQQPVATGAVQVWGEQFGVLEDFNSDQNADPPELSEELLADQRTIIRLLETPHIAEVRLDQPPYATAEANLYAAGEISQSAHDAWLAMITAAERPSPRWNVELQMLRRTTVGHYKDALELSP